jgi:hypothetical protein
MRRIDDITSDRYPARSYETRLSLLRLELEDASLALSWPAGRSRSSVSGYGQRPVSSGDEAEAAQLVARYLRQAQGAAFDAVLRVSAQFGVSVPLDAVREAAVAFVTDWADNPAAGYDPLGWPGSPPVQDMLWDELSGRILDGPSSATVVADLWWGKLPGWAAERADMTSPLQRALLSAAMAHSDYRTRLRIVQANLGRSPVPSASAHYRELADVLWARTPPTPEELRVLHRLVPAGTDLDPALLTGLTDSVSGERLRLSDLELYEDLAEKQLLRPDAETVTLLDYHRELQSVESWLAAGKPPSAIDKLLREVPRRLLIAHGQHLTDALLAIEDPAWVTDLVKRLPPQIASEYLRAWYTRLASSPGPARIAVSFALSRRLNWAAAGARPDLQFDLDLFVRNWCRRASTEDTRDVAVRLAPLGTELVDSWNAHAARNRPNRFRRLAQRWTRLSHPGQHPNV